MIAALAILALAIATALTLTDDALRLRDAFHLFSQETDHA